MRQCGREICRTIITPWEYPSSYSQSFRYSQPHAESAPDHFKGSRTFGCSFLKRLPGLESLTPLGLGLLYTRLYDLINPNPFSPLVLWGTGFIDRVAKPPYDYTQKWDRVRFMVKRGLRIKSMTSPEPPPKMSGWELLSLTGLNIFWDRDTEPHCPLMQLCSYFDYQPALSLSPLKAFDVSTSAFSLLATPNLITVWGTFCQKLFCMFSCFNLK